MDRCFFVAVNSSHARHVRESEDTIYDSLSVDDSVKHRAMGSKLASALLKMFKRDLARRLAVMSETLAQRGLVLAGCQILF